MKGRTWTEVQWGVRYDNDPRYEKGYIETGGIDPGGNIVSQFSKEVCEYIARDPNRAVVRRTIIHSRTEFDWETV